jgi:hypothetical protein
MEEYQEADILWPESTRNPKTFVNWQNYLHFTSSQSEASLSSASSSSDSSCTQDELQESELSWPGSEEDSYFFSITNLEEKEKEKVSCDEEWQEADVLWPEQEGLTKCHVAWENCSVGDEDRLTKAEQRKISSPIDIPKRKINKFVHFL